MLPKLPRPSRSLKPDNCRLGGIPGTYPCTRAKECYAFRAWRSGILSPSTKLQARACRPACCSQRESAALAASACVVFPHELHAGFQ